MSKRQRFSIRVSGLFLLIACCRGAAAVVQPDGPILAKRRGRLLTGGLGS